MSFGTPTAMPGAVFISLDANGEPENVYADQKHIRHVLYNCAVSRRGIKGQTNKDSKEVQTEALTITATPLATV